MFTLFFRTRVLILLITACTSGCLLLASQYAGETATDTTLATVRDADHTLFSATVNGMAVELPEEPLVSISFHSGDVFSGRVGATRYFGMLELTPDGSLRVDSASVAATGQPTEPEATERSYLEALKSVTDIQILNNGIALSSSDGLQVLQFARTPMEKRIAAVKNVEFRLARLVAGGRQNSLSSGKITFVLTDNNRFTGFSGVNQYSGSFEVQDDGRFRHLGPIAATQRAGSPEAMELESLFFSALERVERLKLSAGRLILENDDQTVVLEYTRAGEKTQ